MISMSQQVHCPNCGHLAERHHLLKDQLVRTQCHACDYLMITCTRSGKVIEAYAPGLFVGSAH
ncbi:MAG: replication restart DNA helicase PriA [Leptolyngbya sp.]|nr:replication restart DNA helicase PriA [Leptolyngbya sp.]